MKYKIVYFLPFILMLAAGCIKHNDDIPPLQAPVGIFTGTFSVLKLNTARTGYDTTKKINIILTMDLATGYKVGGDTSALHAGSHGDFALDASNIQFFDYNTGSASKIHLNNFYEYTYDGAKFKILRSYADTLGYIYDLKKQ